MRYASDLYTRPYVPDNLVYLNRRLGYETPHVDDDFFHMPGTLADYGWSQLVPSGTLVSTIRDDVSTFSLVGMTNNDITGFVKPITTATAPITIETRCRVFGVNALSQHGSFFLGFTDGTTDTANMTGYWVYKPSTWQIYRVAGTVTAWTITENLVVEVQSAGFDLYFRAIWKSANTWQMQVSRNGVNWHSQGRADFARTMTPTHYFVGGQNLNAGIISGQSFDYFRVYNADLSA